MKSFSIRNYKSLLLTGILFQAVTAFSFTNKTSAVIPLLQAVAQNVTLIPDINGTATLQASQVNNGSTGSGALTYEIQKIVHTKVDENNPATLTTPNGQNFTEIVYASYNYNIFENGFYTKSNIYGNCAGWDMSNSSFASKLNLAFPTTANTGAINTSNAVLTDPCPGVPKNFVVVAAYSSKQTSLTFNAAELDKPSAVLLIVTDEHGNKSYAIANITFSTLTPVKLINFQLSKENNSIKLNWSTVLEENNQYFIIQRGTDVNDLRTITTLAGSNNNKTISKYSYVDALPNHGVNYYRLIQVDANGKQTILDTKAINYQFAGENEVKISPNPTTEKANVYFNAGAKKAVLTSITGQKIKEFNLTIKQTSLDIDLSALPSGVYTITLAYDKDISVHKIIKK